MRGRTVSYRQACLLLLIAIPSVSLSDETEASVADTCVAEADPLSCLESYGYECHSQRDYHESLVARQIGCNLQLADGQKRFVQMEFDGSTWTTTSDHVYDPQPYVPASPYADMGEALTDYVQAEMRGFVTGISSSGSSSTGTYTDEITGVRREGDTRLFRAVCGVTVNERPVDSFSAETKSHCEKLLLSTMKSMTEPPGGQPFRAGGASQIDWHSELVTLKSGDRALIVEGRSLQPRPGPACRSISDCCATDGVMYLDSCRTPTDSEFAAIADCLADDLQPRTAEFMGCLRAQNVKVGCEDQPDGSRLCY